MKSEIEFDALAKIKAAAQQNFLITLGCDLYDARALAKQLKIPFRQILPRELDAVNGKIEVSSKAIVMCGSIFPLRLLLPTNKMTITADQVFMVNVDFNLIGADQALALNANTLLLVRQNKLTTQGMDAFIITLPTSPISLNITKEVRVYDGGKLDVTSIGASFPSLPATN